MWTRKDETSGCGNASTESIDCGEKLLAKQGPEIGLFLCHVFGSKFLVFDINGKQLIFNFRHTREIIFTQ